LQASQPLPLQSSASLSSANGSILLPESLRPNISKVLWSIRTCVAQIVHRVLAPNPFRLSFYHRGLGGKMGSSVAPCSEAFSFLPLSPTVIGSPFVSVFIFPFFLFLAGLLIMSDSTATTNVPFLSLFSLTSVRPSPLPCFEFLSVSFPAAPFRPHPFFSSDVSTMTVEPESALQATLFRQF